VTAVPAHAGSERADALRIERISFPADDMER
jgi:hypothetical protein